MWDAIAEWHIEYGSTVRALIAATLVATVSSVVGCFIVLRRMSFLADAVAHAMLAGVVAGYLILKIVFRAEEAGAPALLLGATIAGLVTVALIGFVTRVSRIKKDTAIGIMYTGIFALGGFVASLKFVSEYIQIDLYHFVVGSVLAVSDADLWMLGIVSVLVVGAMTLFYRQLKITSFDPIMAASIGIPVVAVDYLLTVCTSLVVVSGVNVVGVVLVVALIITPAATAYLLFDRLKLMLFASATIAVVTSWLGYGLAFVSGTAPGPAIIVVGAAAFALTLFASPKYGLIANWIRRRQMISQPVVEDILGLLSRQADRKLSMGEIQTRLVESQGQLRKAIQHLLMRQLLSVQGDQVCLTEVGASEARRILRAHRLWETYLYKVGHPEAELHNVAHRLEHVHDEEAVDYLDDKLGHPLTDPHGAEIPEDLVHLEGAEPVKLSLLREGHVGIIVQLLPGNNLPGALLGDIVRVGKRSEDGEKWSVHLPTGGASFLNHNEADAVLVRLQNTEQVAS